MVIPRSFRSSSLLPSEGLESRSDSRDPRLLFFNSSAAERRVPPSRRASAVPRPSRHPHPPPGRKNHDRRARSPVRSSSDACGFGRRSCCTGNRLEGHRSNYHNCSTHTTCSTPARCNTSRSPSYSAANCSSSPGTHRAIPSSLPTDSSDRRCTNWCRSSCTSSTDPTSNHSCSTRCTSYLHS